MHGYKKLLNQAMIFIQSSLRIALDSRRSISLHSYHNFHRIGKPWAQPCDDVKVANQSEKSKIPQWSYWLGKQNRDRAQLKRECHIIVLLFSLIFLLLSLAGYINASFSNGSFDLIFQGLQDDFNQSEAALNSSRDIYTGHSLPGAIVTGALLTSIISMTISGNVLVLLAVFVNSHLRSTTNIFIVNLAVADLLLGTTVLPFSASKEIVNYWAFGQTFCDIWAAVDVLCCTASIMSLCVISIDRYIGVTRPLQHSSIMTEKRAILIVLAVWILSIAISVAPLIGWKEPPDQSPRVCTVTEQLGYVIFSVSWSFYIPLVIILLVYFRIYREALKQSRFLSTGIKTSRSKDDASAITLRIHTGRIMDNVAHKDQRYTSSSSSEHSDGSGRKYHSRLTLAGKMAKFKREKKAAQTLGIVVGVFILCWFPFFFILPLGEYFNSL
jgi:hypothetical protein